MIAEETDCHGMRHRPDGAHPVGPRNEGQTLQLERSGMRAFGTMSAERRL
jgi:hypothetical protein